MVYGALDGAKLRRIAHKDPGVPLNGRQFHRIPIHEEKSFAIGQEVSARVAVSDVKIRAVFLANGGEARQAVGVARNGALAFLQRRSRGIGQFGRLRQSRASLRDCAAEIFGFQRETVRSQRVNLRKAAIQIFHGIFFQQRARRKGEDGKYTALERAAQLPAPGGDDPWHKGNAAIRYVLHDGQAGAVAFLVARPAVELCEIRSGMGADFPCFAVKAPLRGRNIAQGKAIFGLQAVA